MLSPSTITPLTIPNTPYYSLYSYSLTVFLPPQLSVTISMGMTMQMKTFPVTVTLVGATFYHAQLPSTLAQTDKGPYIMSLFILFFFFPYISNVLVMCGFTSGCNHEAINVACDSNPCRVICVAYTVAINCDSVVNTLFIVLLFILLFFFSNLSIDPIKFYCVNSD